MTPSVTEEVGAAEVGGATSPEGAYKVTEAPVGTPDHLRVVMLDLQPVVYEKNDDVAGTWFENKYPGVACNIPAHSYQFAWEPNPHWSLYYSPGPEIFIHEVVEAVWNEDKAIWNIKAQYTKTGRIVQDWAHVFINGGGFLNMWKWPDIEGLHLFNGNLFHSAAWPENFDYTGKDVIVLGSGSSVTEEEKKMFNEEPKHYLEYRKGIDYELHQKFRGLVLGSKEQKELRSISTKEMTEKLNGDNRLINAILPDFAAGCRRLTPGIGYPEALTKPNVNVVLSGIDIVTPEGIIPKDGQTIKAQALICATGFDVSLYHIGAFLGSNAPVGQGSIISITEQVTRYIINFMIKMQTQNIRTAVPSKAACDDPEEHTNEYMKRLAFSSHCRSWFKNGETDGPVIAIYPGSRMHYYHMTSEIRGEDWEFTYKTKNRFAYMGNGFSTREEPGQNLSFYLENPEGGFRQDTSDMTSQAMESASSADGLREAARRQMFDSLQDNMRAVPLTCHGHSRPVPHIDFSPIVDNGEYYLISACKDNNPMLRDGVTGDWTGTFIGHKGAVWQARLSQDATLAATASADFSAKIWDTHTGECLYTLPHSHIVRSVAFPQQREPRIVATGGVEKKLRIYDLSRAKPEAGAGSASSASASASSSPSQSITARATTTSKTTRTTIIPTRTTATANAADDPAVCYEIGEGVHGGTIKSIIWNNDSDILTTACEDKKIRWWDLRTQRPIVEHKVDGPIGTCELHHLSDDPGILSVAAGKTVYFFEGSTPGLLYKRVELGYEVASVAVNKSINRFVTGAANDTWARVHDLSTYEEIGKGHHGPIWSICFSPDGKLYGTGSEDGTIKLWKACMEPYGLWTALVRPKPAQLAKQPNVTQREDKSAWTETSKVDEADLDRDWVHDKFEDDRESRIIRRGGRSALERRTRDPEETSGAKLRVDNLHYDLTENDLEDLFNRMGPVTNLSIRYDRAGRSDGVAFVTYKYLEDAKAAIQEFDGANAKGQPIRLTLISSGRRLADYIEPPRRTLFERVERPRNRGRHDRSLSPMEEDEEEGVHGRREKRGRVSKGVDRYVPPGARDRDRSPPRLRRQQQHARRRRGNKSDVKSGGASVGPRPKKTQEELDQEMEDYWNTTSNDPVAATGAMPAQSGFPADPAAAGLAPPAAVVESFPAQTLTPHEATPQTANGGIDDDIDMIE
ncbi:hypothetical protein KEM54_001299 [Ascosphaera aggregata]|nr:hypothetical protein KEM54_001299 [Ascosphaera aggregata]